jgi:putative CRISPR-associated protein (TIGR02619 family)
MQPWLEGGAVSGVVLFQSDTGSGMFCAQALRDYLRGRGVGVEHVHVRGLGSSMWEGLVNLASGVREWTLRLRMRGDLVAVNLTPGFKPEAAYALLASGFAGATLAYYRHELFKETIVIPMIWTLPRDELSAIARHITESMRKRGEAVVPTSAVTRETLKYLRDLEEASRPLRQLRVKGDKIHLEESLARAMLAMSVAP